MKRLDIYDYHLDPCVQSRFEEIWTGCWGFPCGSSGKEPVCQCRRLKKRGFEPWVRKIPWRRAWKSTPVFLPGECHGQRSLAGCSPQGHKQSDMTEATQHQNRIISQSVRNHLVSTAQVICLVGPCHPLKESDLAITNPLLASTGIAHFLKICFVPLLLQKICVSTVFD